jgi:hypothetical protein
MTNRMEKNASLGAAALRGAAAGGHLLRRGALHLPARRPRQNVNLLLREP